VPKIESYRDLDVFELAMDASMEIFRLSRAFPKEERYSLTDQIRRSSRSVCANLGEAWRRRRYEKSFILRLNDAESEAEETRVWLEYAERCEYLKSEAVKALDDKYNRILGKLVRMINRPGVWVISRT
jgi:four helix bundle protein